MSFSDKMLAMIGMMFLMLGMGLRIYGGFGIKTGYTYDEAFTYVAATGHQGEYFKAALVPEDERTAPWNEIVPASQWRSMTEPEVVMPLKTISHDLSHYDIHPPLYYWMLHPLTLMMGTGPATGIMLNLMLFMLNVFLLYKICNKTLLFPHYAFMAMAFWACTPTAIDADLEARSYELLATFSLLYYLVLIRLKRDPESIRALIGLTLVSTMGMLTHFYFGFVIAGGVLWTLARKIEWKPKLMYLGVQPIILMLFFALFPEIFNMPGNHHFQQGMDAGKAFGVADFIERLSVFVHYTTRFFVYYAGSEWPKYIVQAMLAMLIMFGLFKFMTARTQLLDRLRGQELLEPLLWMLGWNFLFSFGLYVTGVAPGQAVSGQYFSYIWPLLCIFLVYVVERMRAHWAVYAMIVMMMGASAWFRTIGDQRNYLHEVPAEWTEQASDADLLLLTHRSMGKVIPIMQQVTTDVPTYLGSYDQASVAQFSQYNSIVLIDNEQNPRTALVDQLKAALPGYTHTTEAAENRYHAVRLHQFVR